MTGQECRRVTNGKRQLITSFFGYYFQTSYELFNAFEKVLQSPPSLLLTVVSTIKRRRQWHPTPVLLPGESHGRRSLVGCSPWGSQEWDTTERLTFTFHFPLSCIGEGNSNPFQCSCLENPRDGGVSWAALYGSHRVQNDRSDLAAAAAAGN